jgi:hypothetical protein
MAKKQAGKPSEAGTASPTENAAPAKERINVGKADVGKRSGERFNWPFSRKNLIWFLASVVVIIVGYIFLSIGPYDSTSSMTIGPVLLVIGYLVILPISIIVRDKPKNT